MYEYQIDSTHLNKIALAENATENIAKNLKTDFEAITHNTSYYFLFGSGSTENRNKMIQLDAQTHKVVKNVDLSMLYLAMQSFAKMEADDFNFEGAIYKDDEWFLLNRGNGKNKKNVTFTVSGEDLEENFRIIANEYKLPKTKGVRSSFTDAIAIDDKIYFLATAENTESTYHDGEVLGSWIGRIDTTTMKIDFTKKIALLFGNEHKGLSEEASSHATGNFVIPQVGMVQSLKIPVACAVSLYEGYRQRSFAGMYDRSALSE